MDNIEQLVNRLSTEAQAVKPAPRPLALGLKWLAFAFAYLAIALLISGVRPDLALQFHRPWFLAEIIILLSLLIATALSAAFFSFPDLHQQRRMAFAPIWISGLFLLVMLFAWLAEESPAPLPQHSFECTLSILACSLLPMIAVFYAMRRFASTHLAFSGTTAVLFAFSIGALWLRFYESNNSIVHVIEWHYLPMIGVGLLGIWLGKVVLKW